MSLRRTAANASFACLALCASLSLCSIAASEDHAPPRPKVVILAEEGSQAIVRQLTEDLHSHGFEVLVTETYPGDDREHAASSTLRMGAVAAMRLRNRGELIEVWVSGSADKPARMREAVVPFTDSDDARGDAVVRAVELMRASLIDIRDRASHAPAPVTPAEPKKAPVLPPTRIISQDKSTARTRPVAITAGLGPLLASGGSSPSFGVPIDLRVGLRPGWGVSLKGYVPTRSAKLPDAEASAHITPTLVGLGGWGSPWQGGVLVPYFGVGASAAVLALSATESPGHVARSETRLAAVIAANAGVSVRISETFGLRLEGWAAAVSPNTEIRFSGRKVGTFGPFAAGGSLSIEVWL